MTRFTVTRPIEMASELASALRRRCRALLGAATLLGAAACEQPSTSGPPLVDATLDAEVRRAIGMWGPVPIGSPQVQDPNLVSLGQSLFFDKLLSGNRDVSCATCHEPSAGLGDAMSLAVGTGGSGFGAQRTLGAGRAFVPRNATSLLNSGIGFRYIFWDGRVNEEGWPGGQFKTPAGTALPGGVRNLLAAQAMFPVTNRAEMRGNPGDVDRFGNPNELAQLGDAQLTEIWRATMKRLLAVQEYVAKFTAAYPGTPTSALGFEHAANALAAFQVHAFTKTNSPFDRYLARDNSALTEEQKRGALLFFGRAQCASCHSGALLGGQQFANAGVPQLGPGVGSGAPLDRGRGEELTNIEFYQFAFRVPQLRNVEVTAPYMHNGAYRALEQVVRHYNNVDSALTAFDPTELEPALRASYHGDAATHEKMKRTLDHRLRRPLNLTETEQRQLVAFLKSLTDPAARNLDAVVPARVPSGLPVRD